MICPRAAEFVRERRTFVREWRTLPAANIVRRRTIARRVLFVRERRTIVRGGLCPRRTIVRGGQLSAADSGGHWSKFLLADNGGLFFGGLSAS